jgi:hypothetical protein
MIKILKKEKMNVFFLSILFFFLGFLILNTFQLPLLAAWAQCEDGICSCACAAPIGYTCSCSTMTNWCSCSCSDGQNRDYCNGHTKPLPDL